MAYNVPVYSQSSINRCWEACGHMLWDWHYRNNRQQRTRYAARAGRYATLNRGLSEQEMTRFYSLLGIRHTANPSGASIRNALRSSPVIVTSTSEEQGHAMVVTCFTIGTYSVVNPCAVMVTSFEEGATDSCTAGEVRIASGQLEGRLGGCIWHW